MITVSKRSWHYRLWELTHANSIFNLQPLCDSYVGGALYYKYKKGYRKITVCNYTWRVVLFPVWVIWFLSVSLLGIATIISIYPLFLGVGWCNKKYEERQERNNNRENKVNTSFVSICWETLKAWKEKHCPIITIQD